MAKYKEAWIEPLTEVVQQGDVLFGRVSGVPEGVRRVKPVGGRVIFAEGEATGHHHSAAVLEKPEGELNLELFEDDNGNMFCRVFDAAGVDVEHQEHKTVHLEPGTYQVRGVPEYDPMEAEIRRVTD
jgi:hypothetical protein